MLKQKKLGLQDESLVKNFSYINGSWHSSESQILVTNPANGEMISQIGNAGIMETKLAVKAAKDAFKMWSS